MSWFQKFKDAGRNHFSGVVTVAGFELLRYEGWEQDWNVMGNDDWQNKALGSYFSCVCEDERFGKYLDGDTKTALSNGKTKKEAVQRLKKTILFSTAFYKWRETNPHATLVEYHKSPEYKKLCHENNL